VTQQGKPLSAAVDAIERGVRLDVGHGSGSFSFDVAERAISLGLRPHHISTDLHRGNINGPVYSLAVTMSKMLHLGVDLYEVIEASSLAPAACFGICEIGPVESGRPANLSVFRVVEREFVARDSYRGERTMSKLIEPRFAVVNGVLYEATNGLAEVARS